MNRTRYALVALLLAVFLALGARAWATSTEARYFDRSLIRAETGTAVIDSAAGVWTGFLPVLTVAPPAGNGMQDVVIVIDLAKATTGWATVATSETITFGVQRAIDGTNYRTDAQDATTAISGTNSATRSVTLHIGLVGPNEALKIAAKLSAETSTNPNLPYVVYYLAPERATFTPSS